MSRAWFDSFQYVWITLVVVIVGATEGAGLSEERAGEPAFWALVGAPLVAIAVLGALRAQRDGELSQWLRPVWGDPTIAVVSAALLVVASILFVHAVAPVGSPRESWIARVYLQFGDPLVLHKHAALVGVGLVVVAACEEIVWRGFITTLLAERIGSRYAWIGSAVLYAVAALPGGWALRDPVAGYNPMLPAASLVMGLVWGAMARRTGRLVPGILSHAAFDWCVVMMFRLWGSSV